MKINIDKTTYVFLLISFLAGYFEYIYLLLIIIFIHEMGHAFIGKLVRFKNIVITIYPFGGVTTFNEDLNTFIYKEFLSLLGGIFFQGLFYLFCFYMHNSLFITDHVFYIVKRINILLVSYNFLPIIPLDGGKLLNILLDIFFPYKISNKISVIISFVFVIIFVYKKGTIFSLLLSLFLIKCIINEINNIPSKYNRFLFERFINKYNFKRIKIVKSINLLYRDCNHIINNEFESDVLHKLFDRKI